MISTLEKKLRAAAQDCVAEQVELLAGTGSRADSMARLHAPERLIQAGDRQAIRWLKKALRAERAKALAGHWSYDANRHLLLRAALRRELAPTPNQKENAAP